MAAQASTRGIYFKRFIIRAVGAAEQVNVTRPAGTVKSEQKTNNNKRRKKWAHGNKNDGPAVRRGTSEAYRLPAFRQCAIIDRVKLAFSALESNVISLQSSWRRFENVSSAHSLNNGQSLAS